MHTHSVIFFLSSPTNVKTHSPRTAVEALRQSSRLRNGIVCLQQTTPRSFDTPTLRCSSSAAAPWRRPWRQQAREDWSCDAPSSHLAGAQPRRVRRALVFDAAAHASRLNAFITHTSLLACHPLYRRCIATTCRLGATTRCRRCARGVGRGEGCESARIVGLFEQRPPAPFNPSNTRQIITFITSEGVVKIPGRRLPAPEAECSS